MFLHSLVFKLKYYCIHDSQSSILSNFTQFFFFTFILLKLLWQQVCGEFLLFSIYKLRIIYMNIIFNKLIQKVVKTEISLKQYSCLQKAAQKLGEINTENENINNSLKNF